MTCTSAHLRVPKMDGSPFSRVLGRLVQQKYFDKLTINRRNHVLRELWPYGNLTAQ